ncbi:unnamed protein product, partial [Polarella glacialis]
VRVRRGKKGARPGGDPMNNPEEDEDNGDALWDFVAEKDKEALGRGAYMETFAGKAVETVCLGGIAFSVLWEIYINSPFFVRKMPMVNILDSIPQG